MTLVGWNGERWVGDLPLEERFSRTDQRHFSWTDCYEEDLSGMPSAIRRTYSNLIAESRDDLLSTTPESVMGRGVLEDDQVLFKWDADEGGYAREFGAWTPTGDRHLEVLEDPTALGFLLPAKPVSVGDCWQIDGSKFGSVYSYGGKIEAPSDGEFDVVLPIDRELADTFEGELKAVLTRIVDVHGRDVAVVSVSGQLEAQGSARPVRPLPEYHTYFEFDKEVSRDVSTKLVLEGEFRWLLEHGDLYSMRLEGKVEWSEEADLIYQPLPDSWGLADHVSSSWTGTIAIHITSDAAH